MNNSITLISPVQSLGYIFAADSIYDSPNANPLDAELKTHLTQNDHSKSFKVICFGVHEEPLRGYIVQYNNCGLACQGLEDIVTERSENRHFRRPHTHLTPPIQRTPSNVHTDLRPTLLETRIHGIHFCR